VATEEHRRTESFARDSREVARARRFVATTLRTWELEADVPVFGLLAIELVANAVVHGAGEIGVELRREGPSLRLEVTDEGGASRPQLQAPDLRGWGLHLVDQLADSWGTEQRDPGTVVWMERRISTP
jgi:anti-sigma regulatory factor (Ser/Thr protein kinase)